MAPTSTQRNENVNRELTLTRTFDAPRELVFNAWVDPIHFEKWWSPKGFTNDVHELDARPNGNIDIDMIRPDGVRFPIGGTFYEIVPPEKLVFSTRGFKTTDGWNLEVLHTVTFEETGGKTVLTLHERVLKATPDMAGPLSGMEKGWNSSLDKLAELFASTK